MIITELIKIIEKLKKYKFKDSLGHPLENCVEYQFLIQYTLECSKHLLNTISDELDKIANENGFGKPEIGIELLNNYINELKMLIELKK